MRRAGGRDPLFLAEDFFPKSGDVDEDPIRSTLFTDYPVVEKRHDLLPGNERRIIRISLQLRCLKCIDTGIEFLQQ